jgi:excisionase family DNA binding protein
MQSTSYNSEPNETNQPTTSQGVAPGSLSELAASKPSWPTPLTYTVGQTAATIGCGDATVYRLLHRRLLTAVPGLRHKLIPRDQVHAYIYSGGKE